MSMNTYRPLTIKGFGGLKDSMSQAQYEKARQLRVCNMLQLKKQELEFFCGLFHLHTKGQYEELLERVHRHIWLHRYDNTQGELVT